MPKKKEEKKKKKKKKKERKKIELKYTQHKIYHLNHSEMCSSWYSIEPQMFGRSTVLSSEALESTHVDLAPGQPVTMWP